MSGILALVIMIAIWVIVAIIGCSIVEWKKDRGFYKEDNWWNSSQEERLTLIMIWPLSIFMIIGYFIAIKMYFLPKKLLYKLLDKFVEKKVN